MHVVRNHEEEAQLAYLSVLAEKSRERRKDLASKKLCINGPTHGPATHGPRCYWCKYVHKHGVARAVAELAVTLRPPNYKPRVRVNDITAL